MSNWANVIEHKATFIRNTVCKKYRNKTSYKKVKVLRAGAMCQKLW